MAPTASTTPSFPRRSRCAEPRSGGLADAAFAAGMSWLAGRATRPVNRPLTQVQPHGGYRCQTRLGTARNGDTLSVLAFSRGGTRAAAFSCGVLEALRDSGAVSDAVDRLRVAARTVLHQSADLRRLLAARRCTGSTKELQ